MGWGSIKVTWHGTSVNWSWSQARPRPKRPGTAWFQMCARPMLALACSRSLKDPSPRHILVPWVSSNAVALASQEHWDSRIPGSHGLDPACACPKSIGAALSWNIQTLRLTLNTSTIEKKSKKSEKQNMIFSIALKHPKMRFLKLPQPSWDEDGSDPKKTIPSFGRTVTHSLTHSE